MLNINITASGIVTGDVGSIIAYEPQTYSEPIRFSYPDRPDTIKKVRYTWGTTTCYDILDSNNCVKIAIQGCGRISMQLIMENPLTGVVVFASNSFDMIVGKTTQPVHSCYKACEGGATDTEIVGTNCNPFPLVMCPPPFPPHPCEPVNNCERCLADISQIKILLEQEMSTRSASDSSIWNYLDNGSSLTLQSPSGKRFKITVDDNGELKSELQA